MTLAQAALGLLLRPFQTFAALRASSPAKPAFALFGLTLGALCLAYVFTPILGAGTLRPADYAPAYGILNLLPAIGAATGLCLVPAVLNGFAAALGGTGGFAAGAAGTLLAMSCGQILALLIVLAARNTVVAVAATFPVAAWGLWLCYAEMRALHGLSRLKSAGAVIVACLAWAALSSLGGYALSRRLASIKIQVLRDGKEASWPAAVQPGGQGQENAAEEYRRAGSLAVDLSTQDVSRVMSAVRGGWQDPDGALAGLLERDQPALESFRRAAALPFCDFTEGKLSVLTPQTPVSSQPLKPVMNLARVLALEGRAYEARGEADKAMDDYAAVLLFSRHLLQQRNWAMFYSLAGGMAANIVWRPLSDCLARDLGSAGAYETLLQTLREARAGTPRFGEALRRETAVYAAVSARTIETVGRLYRPAIREKMLQDGQGLVADIGGRLAVSADQNTPELWDRYFFEELVKQSALRNGNNAFFIYLLTHADGRAWTFFCYYLAVVRFDIQIVNYHLVQSRLNLLETGAAVRAYERRYGKSPPDLQALVPDFLAQASADPFDAFRPYRYRPDPAGGWTIYGLGPSHKDGGGAAAYDVENSGEWYKVAADWRNAPPGEIILSGGPPARPAPARRGKPKRRSSRP